MIHHQTTTTQINHLLNNLKKNGLLNNYNWFDIYFLNLHLKAFKIYKITHI